ncbi:GNAT family N-acetyltransferase [Neptunicella sp. SCSIO 80796]|uniref:GNAT family N-acetyltransferase n=1 Tax=Neptunicella plasticusilytica TaxID=3117012 RepID=UPI003A4E098F
MKLIPPTNILLSQMMNWFTSQQQTYQWGGPEFPFPFTAETFRQGLKLDELNSFALQDDNRQFVAFGQFYLREGRCHLGRLVVSPDQRGRGLGKLLVEQLIKKGRAQLQVSECSLFVLKDNHNALQLYLSLGFILADYPKPMPIEDCFYMVKAGD